MLNCSNASGGRVATKLIQLRYKLEGEPYEAADSLGTGGTIRLRHGPAVEFGEVVSM